MKALSNIPIVQNMVSHRTNKPVANQYEIISDDMVVFQSYSTPIAIKKDGQIYLNSEYWDYSRTTLKYLKEWLNKHEDTYTVYNIDDIREFIKRSHYVLVNM